MAEQLIIRRGTRDFLEDGRRLFRRSISFRGPFHFSRAISFGPRLDDRDAGKKLPILRLSLQEPMAQRHVGPPGGFVSDRRRLLGLIVFRLGVAG